MTKMSPTFVAGLAVGAFVFGPFGMALMAWLTSGAAEDAAREASADVEDRVVAAYMNGIKNARLQMAAESRGMAENAESVGRRFRGGRPA